MKRSTAAGWVAGGLFAATAALTFVVVLLLPHTTRSWSALGMLAWATLAGTVTATALSRAGGGALSRLVPPAIAAYAWFALMMCSAAWGLVAFGSNDSSFTMLYPVTLPIALRTLWTGGRQRFALQPRTILMMICLIAGAPLVYFYGRISPATRFYLVFLAIVGAYAARSVQRASNSNQTVIGSELNAAGTAEG